MKRIKTKYNYSGLDMIFILGITLYSLLPSLHKIITHYQNTAAGIIFFILLWVYVAIAVNLWENGLKELKLLVKSFKAIFKN